MLFPRSKLTIPIIIVILAFTAGLAGCRSPGSDSGTKTPAGVTSAATDTPQATPTITPTPEPMALIINGEGVPLVEYQAQLVQLTAADEKNGITRTPEDQKQMVLDELIDQTILAQAAFENGFSMDEAALQARIDALAAQIGGSAALEEWMTVNGYTQQSFRMALERAAASAWQRDVIINEVPETTDQVRAQQILVRDGSLAEDVHAQLEAGADFATIAAKYDPITGGILGWFPRGYLTQPAVEEAAFALQPGQFSPVIETEFGYHIVFILERADRPLSVDARTTLQHKALAAYLKSLLDVASIEVLVP